MSAVPGPRMCLQEYLTWEEQQPTKNEFHHGEVFAMVGARRILGCVVSNLNRRLAEALDGSGCRVFVEGMKVQIGEDAVLYPDVFVTCDKADLSTDLIFTAPTLVVEVLTPGTQAYDRSQKFALYRRIPTLQEYILVDPDTRRVEAFRRGADGLWDLHDMSESDTLEAASIDCRIAMVDLFDGIDAPI